MFASGLPKMVSDDESLARFVDEKGKLNLSGATWRAFMPPSSGGLSVARHGPTPISELKRLAQLYLGHNNTLGASIFSAKAVTECDQSLVASEPPERHCEVQGWKVDMDQATQKEMRKVQAMKLHSMIDDWIPF